MQQTPTRQRLRPSGISPRWGLARTRLVDGAGFVGRRLGRARRPTDGRASPLPLFGESGFHRAGSLSFLRQLASSVPAPPSRQCTSLLPGGAAEACSSGNFASDSRRTCLRRRPWMDACPRPSVSKGEPASMLDSRLRLPSDSDTPYPKNAGWKVVRPQDLCRKVTGMSGSAAAVR